MAAFIEIKIVGDDQVRAALDRVAAAAEDTSPIMRELSEILYEQTRENFAQEGRPAWLPLAPATVAAREARGRGAHPILQVTGTLLAAVHPSFTKDSARVGVAAVYAAIQQLGGRAGRGGKVTVPARPYLPVTADGELQPQARIGIVDALNTYLRDAIEGR